jgi:hypothetical protein
MTMTNLTFIKYTETYATYKDVDITMAVRESNSKLNIRFYCIPTAIGKPLANTRFQVPTAVTMNTSVICDVRPCNLVDYKLFDENCCLHLQGRM